MNSPFSIPSGKHRGWHRQKAGLKHFQCLTRQACGGWGGQQGRPEKDCGGGGAMRDQKRYGTRWRDRRMEPVPAGRAAWEGKVADRAWAGRSCQQAGRCGLAALPEHSPARAQPEPSWRRSHDGPLQPRAHAALGGQPWVFAVPIWWKGQGLSACIPLEVTQLRVKPVSDHPTILKQFPVAQSPRLGREESRLHHSRHGVSIRKEARLSRLRVRDHKLCSRSKQPEKHHY